MVDVIRVGVDPVDGRAERDVERGPLNAAEDRLDGREVWRGRARGRCEL